MQAPPNLSDDKTVRQYLKKCRLPFTPFTSYVLKQTVREYAQKKRVDTKTLDQRYPIVIKDVDVLEYNLGQPVSVKEAHRVFLRSDIDVEKIPKDQKDHLDLENKTMMDFITLQETPLSDFVQLQVTGELLTRENFEEMVQHNTTRWCAKQSVGFKTPGGGILGNLVLYNFDGKSFFPQKPGTLRISTVPNVAQVPSETHPKVVVPSKYFRLEYFGKSSFLPDTSEGRRVLGLMKDAFKKGNLYAFDRYGYVRNGRIHKKTSLSGTAWSYPDDTYLQRVSGELSALGSTPFLYQFSDDPHYTPQKDPYPLETRFRIEFV
jgi:hypothetical protein